MLRRRFGLLFVFSLLVAGLPLTTAAPAVGNGGSDLVITAAFDGPLSGGLPKGVEVYVMNDVADLSVYGLGASNNGAASNAPTFAFTGSASAGDFLYVTYNAAGFTSFFGFDADAVSSEMNINGDDVVELFLNGVVVDAFGAIGVDGTGEPWEHLDGWAYRNDATGPDAAFVVGDWYFSGINALDGETTNATATHPVPIGTYAPAPPVPTVLINEVDSDTPGTDAAEFLELYDGGVGSTDLSGKVLVFFNGSSDTSYEAFDLDTYSTDANGYFVLCGDALNVANCDLDVSPNTNLIQNGADAVALYTGDAADFPDGTAVTTTNLIDALVYDTSDADDTALMALLNAGQPQVNEDANGNKDTESNQRCPNGAGALRDTSDYEQWEPTPGTENLCADPVTLLINEVDSDTPGTDAAEFLELYDGGVGSTALDDFVVVLFNGSTDTSYGAIDLDGQTTDANGYFVLCGDAGDLTSCDLDSSESLQNGADAVALYQDTAASFPDGTAVTITNLIDALVYDTSDADDTALMALLNAGQPQVNEDANGNKDTESNQRCPNGAGALRNTDTYDQHAPTPGVANVCPVPEVIIMIHEVQGSGATTPIPDTIVTIEGVVVGDFQDTDLGGFWLQEEDSDADADPLTSEGIFVYNSSDAVAVGDTVKVTGMAKEYYDATQISQPNTATVTGSGAVATPVPLAFPVAADFDFETIEGMAVVVAQPMVITEYYNFDRYGEVVVAAEFPMQPTAVFAPGSAEATTLAELNALSRITIDDGQTGQNPDPALHPNGAIFDLTNRFRGGDTLSNITGVIHDSFGYRIHPTAGATYVAANPRPATPTSTYAGLRVATFNVLNYFDTIDTGAAICGPVGGQNCRGADNAEEFTRQRDKIIAAIDVMDADIIGLMEIENNADSSLIDLVGGLNARAGAGTYAYVDAGTVGPDAIKVAIIYKPAKVTPLGAHAILDSNAFLDPNNLGSSKNRAALAQSFTDIATGEVLTVAVNHLKSKGSDCGGGDDEDDLNGGNCNLTRTLGAQVLVDWLAGDPTGSGDPDILVIGDLNSYDKEDPIVALMAGPDDTGGTGDDYQDLVFEFAGENAFSYVYSGQWGYLDYAMANESLFPSVIDTSVWHINAAEPDLLDYDTGYKKDAQDLLYETNAYRSSDHDPVIVELDLSSADSDGDGVLNSVDNCPLRSNANQRDRDRDGIGNLCDDDMDGDGIHNVVDNCPARRNVKQRDRDHDGIGNPCDTDLDGDGIVNWDDNCPARRNANQADFDGDGLGDRCDPDDDNDGVGDRHDRYPLDPTKWGDDSDHDGVWDEQDNCPLIKNASQRDTDGDGLGNRCDDDNDNDGYLNRDDAYPFNPRRH